MKQCLTFLILFVLAIRNVSGQAVSEKDSLLEVIKSSPDDSNKAVTYLLYGGFFEVSNPDSAQYYYNKSWRLAEKLNYKRAMGMNISYQIALLNNRGKFREALELCKKAVDIYRELKSDRDLAIALNNVGNEQQYLGELRAAIDHYLQANAIAERINDSILIRLTTNNVASVFVTLKQFDKGRLYASQSYEVARKIRDTFGMATSLVNLATAEAAEGKYALSMDHLQLVIQFSEYVDDYTLALDGYTNIGSIYNSLKQYNRAETQLQKALALSRKYENPAYELVALQGLTDTYIGQKNFKDADVAVMKAIEVAIATGSNQELRDLYMRASEVKEGRGDVKNALHYRKMFETLHDTLLNEEVRNNISELEVQYQTARKDRAIAEQNLTLEKNKVAIQQKNVLLAWSLGGIMMLLVLSITAYWYYRQKQKLNAEKILSLKKEQEVIRLKALLEGQDAERQRISKEMHDDVGSGLTTILYLSENLLSGSSNDTLSVAPKISRTANNLVEKMNEIIWSLNKKFDSVEDLVVYIRHSISELLDDRDINYTFVVPEEIPHAGLSGEQRRNMYLVVKEAVHNAIKHSAASLITITFEIDSNFSITVHDNGKGIDPGNLRRFGNGMLNMKQRMENIGGIFEVIAGNGTTIRASIPLKA